MGVQTDKILNDINSGKIDDASIDAIDSIDEAKVRRQIGTDIDASYPSRSRFATECGIQPSQLSDFINQKKHFGRDNLLTMFIALHYDCEQIQDTLKYLGEATLYARNKRDRRIIKAVRDKKSLDETDQFLMDGDFEPLSQNAKEVYKGAGKNGNGKHT